MSKLLRILVVCDGCDTRNMVMRTLEAAGLEVKTAEDRAESQAALMEQDFSLVVLSSTLPDADGYELCAQIREHHDISLVMLAAGSNEEDVVRALDSGADDCVRKGFGARELRARVQAVLRRSRLREGRLPATINVGPLTLDSKSYRANVAGEPLPLTPTEYRLLALLVQNLGRVLTHGELLQFVWGPGYEGEHHMLHVTMSRLRQKLGALSDPSMIRTTPGVGYEFVA